MEAGLLAIAGGASFLTATDVSDTTAEEEALLLSRKFGNLMQLVQAEDAAADKQDKLFTQLISVANHHEATLEEFSTTLPDIEAVAAWNGAVVLAQQSVDVNAATAGEDLPHVLWTITDSLSGSNKTDGSASVQPFLVLHGEGEGSELLPLTSATEAQEISFSEEEMLELQEMLDQLLLAHELSEENVSDGVPLVTFVQLPLSSWNTALQERKIESVQFIDTNGGISRPVPDALAVDDFAQLSDADLAKLDALIDRVTQQAGQRSSALGDFRQTLSDVAAPNVTNSADLEQIQVSSLSASHSTNQTQSQDDRLGVRVLQATPTPQHESGSATDQVRVSISQAVRIGMDRIQIQLEPLELGRVEIRMDLGQDGRAQILIQADNRDTLDMLQRDSRSLMQALQEAGIEANAEDMAFNLNEGNDGSDQTGTDDARGEMADSLQDEGAAQDLIEDQSLEAVSNYTLSIAQGLDIKV